MDRVRSAVVGLGGMGTDWHAATLNRLPQFDLVAGCDPSEGRRKAVAERFGMRTYADLTEMLAEPGLELVVVATPNEAHMPSAVEALDAGKHVVVEKPFCLNLAEFEAMAAAAEANQRVVCAYQNRRWDDWFLTANQVVHSGVLGRLFFIQSAGGTLYTSLLEVTWRAQQAHGGGALLDWGAHSIDQFLCLVDHCPVEDVFADLRAFNWAGDADDNVVLVLRFANGVVATLQTSWCARAAVSGTAIVGSEGAFRDGKLYTGEREAIREVAVEEVKGNWDDFYRGMYAAIRERAPAPVPLDQTRVLMEVFDAARESSRTRQVVRLQGRQA